MDSDEHEKFTEFEDDGQAAGIAIDKWKSRNSLTHEEIEQKLDDLIDTYRKSLQDASLLNHDLPHRDLSKTFLPSYDSSALGQREPYGTDNIMFSHESSMPVVMTPISNYSIHSTFLNADTSPFSSLGAHQPSANVKKLYNTSPMNDNRGIEPLKLNGKPNYGSSFYILPSQDPINIQIDETVTFKKMLNSGISSQLSKQISFLLFELNRLKDENERMNTELKLSKMELNSVKNQLILAQNKGRPKDDENANVTGVIQEIYMAQKMRDAAMIERLKEVNLMKNAAMFFADQSHRLSSSEDDIVSSLVRSQSMDDLKNSTSNFLKAIADEKDKKRIANEQEIEAILFEKDLIHKQKKGLDHEMKLLFDKLKFQTDIKEDLQHKLVEVEKERNQFLSDLRLLKNELKDLKMHENLFKSLSKEEELHHQFSHKLSQLHNELEVKDKQIKMMKLEMQKFSSTFEQLNSSNKNLISKCNLLEEQLRKEKEQVNRLNRLVEVLRRKLKEASINIQF